MILDEKKELKLSESRNASSKMILENSYSNLFLCHILKTNYSDMTISKLHI